MTRAVDELVERGHDLIGDVEVGEDLLDVVAVLQGFDQLEDLARALLIQCFQFDAPPVRGLLPPPKGADPASDGRAAVAEAMRAAARAGVETWQVNMRFDELGVELLGCFRLDLFPSSAASCSSSSLSSSSKKKKATATTKKTKSSSPSFKATAAATTGSFESFFSSFSSSSSSGDESDDGGALAAA